jgi:hypothetical protein
MSILSFRTTLIAAAMALLAAQNAVAAPQEVDTTCCGIGACAPSCPRVCHTTSCRLVAWQYHRANRITVLRVLDDIRTSRSDLHGGAGWAWWC